MQEGVFSVGDTPCILPVGVLDDLWRASDLLPTPSPETDESYI